MLLAHSKVGILDEKLAWDSGGSWDIYPRLAPSLPDPWENPETWNLSGFGPNPTRCFPKSQAGIPVLYPKLSLRAHRDV